jgi:hypothetical protein
MDESNSPKTVAAKAPQLSDMETFAIKRESLSPVERHLGLIKAMAVVMAVLIVTALVVIVVTIYGRLTATDVVKIIQENELKIPFESRVTSASIAEKGQMVLVIEDATGQELWHISPSGSVQRKTRVIPSP